MARIGAALRAAGIEVWFDRNELRGGDTWDAKIRRQIKECTLFVPVISANTEARPEGYFRLEWKLAVDRSHLMADDQPFLFPVVIDDTPDATARVPDKFREVQWTRLDLKDTPGTLALRVASLLGGPAGGVAPVSERRMRSRSLNRRHPRRWVPVIFAVGGVTVSLIYALRGVWHPGRSEKSPAVSAAVASTSVTTPLPTVEPVSEARKLVLRARELYEPWDGATREDFALAEELVKRAAELDPSDGEVWAAYALLSCGKMLFGHDRSEVRREFARSSAERAVKLSPDSNQARFARAFYFRFQEATRTEAERMLREVVEREPANKLMVRTLGSFLRDQRRVDEALSLYDRAAALPGGDPVALYNKYLTLRRAQRYEEAEAAIDRALATVPTGYNYRAKVNCLVEWHGDLDGAAAVLAKVPGAYLMEDAGVLCASRVWLWRREADKCIAILNAVPRDTLDHDSTLPKGFLLGQAHRIAGREEAAQIEWRAALQVVERQLVAQPATTIWNFWKAYLLALTGRTEEGERALAAVQQLMGSKAVTSGLASVYIALGKGRPELVAALKVEHERLRQAGNRGALSTFENAFRFDPMWDPLRDVPEFMQMLETFTPVAKSISGSSLEAKK